MRAVLECSLAALNEIRACQAIEALGWLAPWWLRSEVVQLATRRQPAYGLWLQRPKLPLEPGGCWIVFRVESRYGVLREAVLLPCRWVKGTRPDPCLPAALQTVAQQVVTQFQGQGWTLHLARPCGAKAVDLEALLGNIGIESGWAALAGGLVLAQEGLSPRAEVWASVAWDETFGVGSVSGLEAKLRLACDWQVKHMFIPAQNLQEVAAFGDWIQPLAPKMRSQPREILAPYLEQLGAEPDPSDWPRVQRFAATSSRLRAEHFFWHSLRPYVVDRCRESLPSECRPRVLVSVAGAERGVIAQAAEVFAVQRVVLFTSGSSDSRVERAIQSVREVLQATVEVLPLGEGGLQSLKQAMTQALHRERDLLPAEQWVFDLTPGFKVLSLALEAAAPPGSWLVYCRHQTDSKGQAIPGTQHYECWRKGEHESG
jgi:hypothetical protein